MSYQSYVVVGAGGTASHLIHALNQYVEAVHGEDGFIHVWDNDAVEQSNLSRQLFYPYEIGNHKAEAFHARFPQHVRAHIDFIGPENVEDAIQNEDIVLICADNMFVRKLINERAKELNTITIINGGNEMHTGSVQTFVKIDGVKVSPDLEWLSPELHIEDGDRSAMSCNELAMLPGGEQTIIANMTTASLMLAALWRVDQGVYNEERQWTKVTYDHRVGTFQTSDVRLTGGTDA
jgi:molybdopterin/thiamine biosynthesis adenylyltransferase